MTSGASSTFGAAAFLVFGFAILAESLTDLGVESPLAFGLGVVVNLMVVFGFLTESDFGISYIRSAVATFI